MCRQTAEVQQQQTQVNADGSSCFEASLCVSFCDCPTRNAKAIVDDAWKEINSLVKERHGLPPGCTQLCLRYEILHTLCVSSSMLAMVPTVIAPIPVTSEPSEQEQNEAEPEAASYVFAPVLMPVERRAAVVVGCAFKSRDFKASSIDEFANLAGDMVHDVNINVQRIMASRSRSEGEGDEDD